MKAGGCNMFYCISIGILLLSITLSWLIIKHTIRFAYKKDFFDKPNFRKIHKKPIPRLGGFSFYITSVISFVLTIFFIHFWGGNLLINELNREEISAILWGLVGSSFLFAFGVTDDLTGIRYRTKFIGQMLSAVILCASGTWINNLHGLFGVYALSAWEGYLITFFAVVLVTNAFNFIDGIDGLAASLCLLTLINILIVALLHDQKVIALFSIIVIGSVIPFLYFNIFGKPEKHTKTFMGDTGSLFLGFVMCFLGIKINNNLLPISHINPFVLAFSSLIIPCFDVLRVVMIRLYKKRNPFIADKSHIHHLLLACNLSQHKTLAAINAIAISFILISYVISYFYNLNIVLVALFLLWVIVMMIIYRNYIDKKQKKTI